MASDQDILDAINTALSGGKPKKVTIGNKSIERYGLQELMDVKNDLEAQIKGAAKAKSGISFGKVKFRGHD